MEKKRAEIMDKILAHAKEAGTSSEGKLPPEREMAKLFGVSRVLLREAIVALEVTGLLEIKGRQGIYVKEPELGVIGEGLKTMPIWPDKFLSQFLEIRTIIEINAVRLAAKRRSDEELERMEHCLEKMRMEIKTPEDIALQGHYEFLLHYMFVEATHNDIMKRIYESLRSLFERHHSMIHDNLTREPMWSEQVLSDQTDIVDAIRKKDEGAAERAMLKHMSQMADRYCESSGEDAR